MGISEGSLYNIFKKDSFEIAYLLKVAELVGLPASSFLEGNSQKPVAAQPSNFSQANGGGGGQKARGKVNKPQLQQDLAAALAACQRELEVTRALVAAKDETIILLRSSYSRPT